MPRRVLHDRFFKQAKAEGYLARSAYKLQQIQDAKRLMRKGCRVLDLGCAPGAWLQVASACVGPRGSVVGIDLKPVDAPLPSNVAHTVGDIEQTDPVTLTAMGLPPGGLFDVVLSDMAPNTTGHGDDLVSARLCERVLDILPGLLKPGGNLAMKIFEGSEYPRLLRAVQQQFGTGKGFKPEASREVSREMYLIGLGYAPRAG